MFDLNAVYRWRKSQFQINNNNKNNDDDADDDDDHDDENPLNRTYLIRLLLTFFSLSVWWVDGFLSVHIYFFFSVSLQRDTRCVTLMCESEVDLNFSRFSCKRSWHHLDIHTRCLYIDIDVNIFQSNTISIGIFIWHFSLVSFVYLSFVRFMQSIVCVCLCVCVKRNLWIMRHCPSAHTSRLTLFRSCKT